MELNKRLHELLQQNTAKATYQDQYFHEKVKFKNRCTLSHSGATFTVDPAFLGYLFYCANVMDMDTVILTDINDVPVMITDLMEFLETASSAYTEAATDYYNAVDALRRNRAPAKMLGVTDDE